MRAKLITTVKKSLQSNKNVMEELSRDGWNIKHSEATLEIALPSRVFKVGECISFSSYWGDIESMSYNVRLGIWEYYLSFDYEAILEQ